MNVLSFDIEEWFHILDTSSVGEVSEWDSREVRLHKNMDRIFSMLEQSGSRATFFCLGWVAGKFPEIIKEIDRRGYEIGSHGSNHQLVYQQDQESFRSDLERSIGTLEDLTGKKVRYYRAPGFSITENNLWALELIHAAGIEVDSSIFPAPRAHGGLPGYSEQLPSVISYRGIELRELPINYTEILGKPLIFSGGGYFRLLPYPLLKKFSRSSGYIMSYLHPRDFDAGQPVLEGLPIHRRFKSYVGLKGAEKKLIRWLQDFKFTDFEGALEQIDWEAAPRVEL